ncbi:MAG: Rpn family recombination-promoting nuclease/putative transposase [Muribaculum sp.]|nr:Rpn family recombination-promoting nuclease/putative transposase [Muribaculum sp.]
MGKYDDAMYSYLSDNGRFADLFNGAVFHGEEVLCADALEEGSGRYVRTGAFQGQGASEVECQRSDETDKNRKQNGRSKRKNLETQNRYRDIKKHLKEGGSFSVVAIENQSDTDFTMPWRIMMYDSLEYEQQIREIENGKRQSLSRTKKNVSHQEIRFSQEDRLHPVYTICLYHGTKPWEGPKCLGDMMEFKGNKKLQEELFHDYRMSLVCVEDLKELSAFQTDLRLLLAALGTRRDKEAMKELYRSEDFADISAETARTIAIMTDNTQILKKLDEQNEEGEINMCQAWDEIQEEWREEGRAEGREEGRKEGKAEERKEGIRIFILDNIEEGKSGETIVEKLCRRFSLDVGAAQAYYNTYAASV